MTKRSAFAAAVLAAFLAAAAPRIESARAQNAAPAAVSALAGQHPAEYYKRATALFQEGKKEDAIFVFYLGQLRYRAHLLARPNLPRDGDPALFASLSEVVGRPLNEYAFGDIPALARTIEAVLAHDSANPDRFTPPAQFPQACASTRNGLAGLRTQILAEAESIRARRRQKGMEYRN